MKRDYLEGLGLEKEVIDGIMAEHGKTIATHQNKVTELTGSIEDVQGQLLQRDKDLKELKKQAEGSEELQTKFAELEVQYKADKESFATKIKDTQLSSALKLALNGKVHDIDLVAGLIDKATIELGDDGNVTKGLDEQITTLQESKSFLFVPEVDSTPIIQGAKPAEGNPGGGEPSDPFAAKLAKYQ